MEKRMSEEKLNFSIWNYELNAFLSYLDLSSRFVEPRKGIVEDKKGQVFGKSNILNFINADSECLQTDICHPYGGIRIRIDNMMPTNSILCFQISRDGSSQIKGIMTGNLTEEKFLTTRLELDSYEKGDIVQTLSLQTDNKAFYYHNYKTKDKISLFKKDILNRNNRTVISSSFQSKKKETLKTIVTLSEDTQKVSSATTYNTKTGSLLLDDTYLTSEKTLFEQFKWIVEENDPMFYEKMSAMVNSYESNGTNIVKPAIVDILLPELTVPQSECLFGKKLAKELTAVKK